MILSGVEMLKTGIRLSQSRPGVQYFKEFTIKVFFNIRKLHYMHNLLHNEIKISRRTEVRVNFFQKGILAFLKKKIEIIFSEKS